METLNLNALVAKNIKIELKDQEYIIPEQPPMDFVIQLQEIQSRGAKEKKADKQLSLLVEVCKVILNQDESKNVDEEFVRKNLTLAQMNKLAQFYQEQIERAAKDPN
ncbi:hypothetical protein [Bacillus weihaiensis]|uniref:hypothetical protein n=1 Tax=Bacillus weihaiensis TaxID=1547283 RepID=UPI0023551BD3|nr:hypothetical protein [Bacillus weihaiensis]